ncbi:MAG: hypothetical protein Q8S13_05245, partial [Dehalococcoidia bacterium]|nr:hypothetical protein [Dehalococcoidia bacterium]
MAPDGAAGEAWNAGTGEAIEARQPWNARSAPAKSATAAARYQRATNAELPPSPVPALGSAPTSDGGRRIDPATSETSGAVWVGVAVAVGVGVDEGRVGVSVSSGGCSVEEAGRVGVAVGGTGVAVTSPTGSVGVTVGTSVGVGLGISVDVGTASVSDGVT